MRLGLDALRLASSVLRVMGRHRLASLIGLVLAVGWIVFNAGRGRYGSAHALAAGTVPIGPAEQHRAGWADSVSRAFSNDTSAADAYPYAVTVACVLAAACLLLGWPTYLWLTERRERRVRYGSKPRVRGADRSLGTVADDLSGADAAVPGRTAGAVLGAPGLTYAGSDWSEQPDGTWAPR